MSKRLKWICMGLTIAASASLAQQAPPAKPWVANPDAEQNVSPPQTSPSGVPLTEEQLRQLQQGQSRGGDSGGGGGSPMQGLPGTQSGQRDESVSSGDSDAYSPSDYSTASGGPDSYASQLTSNGKFPIIPLFKEYFQKCTTSMGYQGECGFKNMGIKPSAAHCAKSPRSCHNTGEAIDVGFPVTCKKGGATVSIGKNDPEAMKLALCFATQADNKLGVIFKDHVHRPNMFAGRDKGAHDGHIHVQIRHCRKGPC